MHAAFLFDVMMNICLVHWLSRRRQQQTCRSRAGRSASRISYCLLSSVSPLLCLSCTLKAKLMLGLELCLRSSSGRLQRLQAVAELAGEAHGQQQHKGIMGRTHEEMSGCSTFMDLEEPSLSDRDPSVELQQVWDSMRCPRIQT